MLTNFRKLNKGEKELMDKQFDRHWGAIGSDAKRKAKVHKAIQERYLKAKNSLSVSYQTGDPFTVCIVKQGKKRIAGVAKRVRYAPMADAYSEEKGMNISFSSAIRAFLEGA